MASRRTRPQDLSTGSNLEAFRHCFARFAACDGLRHTAGKLIRAGAMTNALLLCVCTARNAFGFTEWRRRVVPEGRARWRERVKRRTIFRMQSPARKQPQAIIVGAGFG